MSPASIAVSNARREESDLLADPLLDMLESIRLPADKPVYHENECSHYFFIVQRGLLGHYRYVKSDKRLLVSKMSRGDPVGLSPCLLNEPYKAELIPFKESLVYRGSQQTLSRLMSDQPGFVNQLLLRENRRYQKTSERLKQQFSNPLEERIAYELLDLSAHLGRRTERGLSIIIPLTRRTISRMMGCATESVIRAMSPWEKKGWIRTENGRITIVKPAKLVRLLDSNPPGFKRSA